MYCSACGNQVAPTSRYCSHCGVLIPHEKYEPEKQTPSQPQQEETPPTLVSQRQPSPERKPRPPDVWDPSNPPEPFPEIGTYLKSPQVAAIGFLAAVIVVWLLSEASDSTAENMGAFIGIALGCLFFGGLVALVIYLVPDGRRYFAGLWWPVVLWAASAVATFVVVGGGLP